MTIGHYNQLYIMLAWLGRILRNRNVIMSIGLAAGLIWGDGAQWLKDLTLPTLAITMTLSTMAVTTEGFRTLRSLLVPALAGTALTYAFHGTGLLVMNHFFVADRDLWEGFVLLAAVPPAVAVIPFAFFLEGDGETALAGTIGAYLAALVITPAIALIFLGSGFINPYKVFLTLVELIIIPLVLSRLLLNTAAGRLIEPIRGQLINWTFFLVIYIMVGLNRDVFLHQPGVLLLVTAITGVSTFGFGWIVHLVGRKTALQEKKLTSLMLLATYKNYGLAGGIALTFFSPEAAVPATVGSVVGILYIIYLGWRHKPAR